MLRYTENSYEDGYQATIGIDFKFKQIEHEGQQIRLALWDTAGQEKFQTITKAFYQNTDGFVFVFDLASLDSFNRLRDFWLPQVHENHPGHIIGILVGNKADLKVNEELSKEAKELALA